MANIQTVPIAGIQLNRLADHLRFGMDKDQAAALKNFSQQSGVFNQHKTGTHIHKHLRAARPTAADNAPDFINIIVF